MATFFGEVLTISSRAVDDDDEEEDSRTQPWIPLPELEWCTEISQEIEKSLNKVLKCSSLIVAVGTAASGFVEAYILQNETERVGCISAGRLDSQGSTTRQQAHSNRESILYRLSEHPEVIVCQCKQEVLPEQAFQWAQKLFLQIATDSIEVIVLDSSTVQNYRAAVSMSEVQTPFLRCLRTSTHKSTQIVQFLESPNTVRGMSAAVLSHCQVNQLPAILYVAFLESMFIDLDSFKVFTPLMQSAELCKFTEANSATDNVLKKIVYETALKDSLYI